MVDKRLEANLRMYYKVYNAKKKQGLRENAKENFSKLQRKLRKEIISYIDDTIIPLADFFNLLGKLEKKELLKFELYRYHYTNVIYEDDSIKDGIEFFECTHKENNISLRILFNYFNFDKERDKFSFKEKIRAEEVIDPDYQLIFDGLRKYYKKEYSCFVNIIIKYLLEEYNII